MGALGRGSSPALGLAAALVVVLAPAAAAQGPRWTFTPGLSISEMFDDNVRLSNPSPDPNADETTEDFSTGVRPWAEVSFVGRRARFDGTYEATFLRYAEVSALNRFQQRGGLSLSRQITRHLTLFARDNFSITPTTDEALEEVIGGTPFRRVGSRVNEATGGVQMAFGRGTTAEAAYSYQTIRFDRDEDVAAQLRGGSGQAVTGSVRHRLTRRLAVGGDYLFRHAVLVDESETFDVQHAEAAADLQVTETMSLSGALGMARLVTSDTTQTGPSYRLGWSHATPRASVSATYRRSYVPSFGFGGTFDNQELRATAQFAFTQRVYSRAHYALRQADALRPGEEPFLSTRVTVRLGYAVARWASIEGFYALSHQDARRAGGTVDRNRVGIQFTTSTPLRIR